MPRIITYWTRKEAAYYLEVTERTIDNWIKAGFVSTKKDWGRVLIKQTTPEEIKQNQRITKHIKKLLL